MIDSSTPSANIVVGKSKDRSKLYSNPIIVIGAVLLVILIVLLVIFLVDRARVHKIQSALTTAHYDNNHNLPLNTLSQLQKIQGMKMSLADQESVGVDKMTAYSLLSEYGSAVTAGEQAFNIMPSNTSLLLTIAQLAQANNDTKTAIIYYKKAVTILGNLPENKQNFTYKSDLENLQAELKVLEQ